MFSVRTVVGRSSDGRQTVVGRSWHQENVYRPKKFVEQLFLASTVLVFLAVWEDHTAVSEILAPCNISSRERTDGFRIVFEPFSDRFSVVFGCFWTVFRPFCTVFTPLFSVFSHCGAAAQLRRRHGSAGAAAGDVPQIIFQTPRYPLITPALP